MDKLIEKIYGLREGDLAWAKSQRDRYPLNEQMDGRGDAAAHMALGYITQRSKHPEEALRAANLREYLTGIATYSREMDIGNNKIGALIDAPDLESAQKQIDALIKGGKAKYYSPKESKKESAKAYGLTSFYRSRGMLD